MNILQQFILFIVLVKIKNVIEFFIIFANFQIFNIFWKDNKNFLGLKLGRK